jgi:ABC-type dipeptide/oligopeptide/nickel transport system permease subunit
MRFNHPRDWFGPRMYGRGFAPRTWEGWLVSLLIPVGVTLLMMATGQGHWGPTGFHP